MTPLRRLFSAAMQNKTETETVERKDEIHGVGSHSPPPSLDGWLEVRVHERQAAQKKLGEGLV